MNGTAMVIGYIVLSLLAIGLFFTAVDGVKDALWYRKKFKSSDVWQLKELIEELEARIAKIEKDKENV